MLTPLLLSWELGAFWRMNGIVELWEHTAATPFSSATKIWEGRGVNVTIGKEDTITRYYWVRMSTIGGQISGTDPSGDGLPGTAAKGADLLQGFDAGPYTRSNII